MDLHTGQLQGFFDIPVDHMTAVPILAQYFRDKGLPATGSVVVSPDAGGAKRAKKFADKLDTSLAILTKERPQHNVAEVTSVIGEVQRQGRDHDRRHDRHRRHAVRGRPGAARPRRDGRLRVLRRTPCSAARRSSGIRDSVMTEVVVTDTIPVSIVDRPDNIRVLSVAGVLADTIRNVFCDESVVRASSAARTSSSRAPRTCRRLKLGSISRATPPIGP